MRYRGEGRPLIFAGSVRATRHISNDSTFEAITYLPSVGFSHSWQKDQHGTINLLFGIFPALGQFVVAEGKQPSSTASIAAMTKS